MKLMKNPSRMPASLTSEQAEEIAVKILAWLSGQDDLMSRFLAMTGIEARDIRRAAGEPGFFGGLTGFLMNHEPTLMAFSAESDVPVERIQAAHRHFAGPSDGVWL
ncbi:DUF3572 domain-containing protein [Rhizobium sp. SG_E_25_P2]|uniref:DUF3572 domain-containing protein n=1 Tax=Rhizobium sp. SG_E_25_P2 TaxID=2879942 RepID=UPI002476D509|nr:DUF3572 domain-containing protein [Rhizobium sp. SG_E_25_P2]